MEWHVFASYICVHTYNCRAEQRVQIFDASIYITWIAEKILVCARVCDIDTYIYDEITSGTMISRMNGISIAAIAQFTLYCLWIFLPRVLLWVKKFSHLHIKIDLSRAAPTSGQQRYSQVVSRKKYRHHHQPLTGDRDREREKSISPNCFIPAGFFEQSLSLFRLPLSIFPTPALSLSLPRWSRALTIETERFITFFTTRRYHSTSALSMPFVISCTARWEYACIPPREANALLYI